eukprot:2121095-Pyramimonas_sp.AAC.1
MLVDHMKARKLRRVQDKMSRNLLMYTRTCIMHYCSLSAPVRTSHKWVHMQTVARVMLPRNVYVERVFLVDIRGMKMLKRRPSRFVTISTHYKEIMRICSIFLRRLQLIKAYSSSLALPAQRDHRSILYGWFMVVSLSTVGQL